MNIENVKKWTHQLRHSGLPQTNGELATQVEPETVAYCCLGVVCIIPEVGVEHQIAPIVEEPAVRHRFDGAVLDLPRRAQDWLGVTRANPFIDWPAGLCDRDGEPYLNGDEATCAGVNDALGLSFAQIADLVDYFGIR